MPIDPPRQGSIIEYPYLWLSQDWNGETEGRKARPVCVVLSVPRGAATEHHLMLLAISSQPPRPDQTAINIPDTERRRAGLAKRSSAWVYTSEYNYDVAERSFYYSPEGPVLGAFSPAFTRQLAGALRDTLRLGQRRVNRTT